MGKDNLSDVLDLSFQARLAYTERKRIFESYQKQAKKNCLETTGKELLPGQRYSNFMPYEFPEMNVLEYLGYALITKKCNVIDLCRLLQTVDQEIQEGADPDTYPSFLVSNDIREFLILKFPDGVG